MMENKSPIPPGNKLPGYLGVFFIVEAFKHRIGNKDLGTIGIIGPKRMDYAKVISVMKYISKKLNDTNDEDTPNNDN